MTTEKLQNYSPEQTKLCVTNYMAGMPVEMIARELGKTTRSVVAKLSREGVYVAKTKATQPRVTKQQLIGQIASKLDLDVGVLESLEKAQHGALEALVTAIR